MPNKRYLKGVRKERKIIKELKEKGFEIAARTAGSHSPIDVFGINRSERIIRFIQSKPDDYPESQANKIRDELNYINGSWYVIFEVI
jgi:hypothetical protein